MARAYLYRYFDADGALLYVGISFSAIVRAGQHRRGARWFLLARRMEIEAFNTRRAAEEAERIAIWNEMPKYNLRHNEACAAREPIARPACISRRIQSNGCSVWRVAIRRRAAPAYFAQFETLVEAVAARDDWELRFGRYRPYERRKRRPRTIRAPGSVSIPESEKREIVREHARMLLGSDP